MSPGDRTDFSHGIGFKPETSEADVKAELERRQRTAAAAADPADGGDFAGDAQTVEYPGLDADLHAGSLQNLPKLQASATVAPAPTIQDSP